MSSCPFSILILYKYDFKLKYDSSSSRIALQIKYNKPIFASTFDECSL